jgi:spermidine synthase
VRPWRTIDSVETPEGVLALRQRGERDFLMTIGGRVLMTGTAHRSEDALAELTCGLPEGAKRPRVLLGGLGMGFTLRAALDRLPAQARVEVVDLNPVVVEWCRGPLGALTANAVSDPRVTVKVANVADVIARARPGSYDVIVLDLYEGPHHAVNRPGDRLYGAAALRATWSALKAGGVFGVWSEDPDEAFGRRLTAAGFRTEVHRPRGGGRTHVIYVGRSTAAPPTRSPATPSAPAKPSATGGGGRGRRIRR